MRLTTRLLILLVLVVSTSCGPKPLSVPDEKPVLDMPAHEGIRNAETALENGRYAEALEGYNSFLRDAEDDRFVDVVLFKIGEILKKTGQDEGAMAVFSRLRNEFPESSRVPDAVLEILHILYEKNDFEAVITDGTAYVNSTADFTRIGPIYRIIAHSFEALDAKSDAAKFYLLAWQAASESDKDGAWTQFLNSLEGLESKDLETMMVQVFDADVNGTLLYRLGMALILEEDYDQAMDVLIAFVDQFPDHPNHLDAVDMIQTLTQRQRFVPFTVGCVIPLSGPYALYGQRLLDGIELALDHLEKEASGIPFQIFIEDSRSDSDAATEAVEALNLKKVGAILGPVAASESAADRSQTSGVPIFLFTQREALPDIGPYVFRNFITPEMQVRALVSFSVDELDFKRFAILYPRENYGRRYMNLFWDQVIEHGGVVTGVEAYDPTGTDFSNPIKKLSGIYFQVPSDLAAEGFPKEPIQPFADLDLSERAYATMDPLERITGIPLPRPIIDELGHRFRNDEDQWHPVVDFDAVFIPDAPKKARMIIPQLAYYDIRDVTLLGTNLWHSDTLLEMSGSYMKSPLIVDGFFAESKDEQVRNFVAAFTAMFHRVPGIVEAMAYDTAMMVFETMRTTATDSRRELKNAFLQITDYDGVTGRTTFLANGEADKQPTMLTIDDGRFIKIHRTHEAK